MTWLMATNTWMSTAASNDTQNMFTQMHTLYQITCYHDPMFRLFSDVNNNKAIESMAHMHAEQ